MATSAAAPVARRLPAGGSAHDPMGTSVGKALALLDAFAPNGGILGVSELARRSGLAKSTAHRLLFILEEHDLVARQGDRWLLGKQLFRLGNLVPSCRPRSLRDRALPYMQDLYELTHETVHLAVPDGTHVLYIEKIYGHNRVEAPSMVGGIAPAYCTGVGKAILARSDPLVVDRVIAEGLRPLTRRTITSPARLMRELAEVRRTGVALDLEEARLGLTCVAAPIMQGTSVVGAVSLSGVASRFRPERYATAVRQAAMSIGQPP